MTKQSLQSTGMADQSMNETDQTIAELFLELTPKLARLINQARTKPGSLKPEERQAAFDMLSELLFARQMAVKLASEGVVTMTDVENLARSVKQQEAADTAAGTSPQDASRNILQRIFDWLSQTPVGKYILEGPPNSRPRPDQLRPAKQSTTATPTPASA